jgi:cell division protein FtsQ
MWWRAGQPPAPRPVLEAAAARGGQAQPRGFRLPFAAGILAAIALLVLGHPERRMAAFAHLERAAELAGLGLHQVSVSGHRFTADTDIYAALDLDSARTLLSFDAGAARARIEELPWIERASIERIVPDCIEVRVAEWAPFALWRMAEENWLIDRTGRKLQSVPADAMPQLLRVAGEGADKEAAALSAVLAAFPQIARQVDLAERVGARRWALHLKGGTSVQLPAAGEAEALARLARLIDAGIQSVEYIDLRVSARVVVRERRDGAGPAKRGPPAPAGRT